jgi:hypothetical protein
MPLQSFAQRTVSHLPHGIRRSLLKLARPEFAGDFTATTEVEARRRRRLQRSGWLAFAATPLALLVWIESGLGVSYRDTAGSRGPSCFRPDPKVLPFALWTPLLGFIKDRPSASTDAVRPLPDEPRPALRPEVAKLRARSALAVLPDYGGLLRSTPCRSVAPCIRPWGSPSFRSAPCPLPEGVGFGGSPSPVALYPSEFSPPQQADARHRTPVPSRRCSEPLVVGPPVLPRLAPRPSARHSTSGFCSAAKSVASPPALPPTNCPILPWAWSQAGSDAFPPPLRGVAGGWPPAAPRDR